VIKSQVLYQLSYAPMAPLLNNLPHSFSDPTDFLAVAGAVQSLVGAEPAQRRAPTDAVRPYKSPYTAE
jgi:hypothetical protein